MTSAVFAPRRLCYCCCCFIVFVARNYSSFLLWTFLVANQPTLVTNNFEYASRTKMKIVLYLVWTGLVRREHHFFFFLDISSIRYRNARWSIGDPSSLKSHFASVKTSRLSDLICNDRQGCGTRYRAELNIRRLNICTIPISTIPDIHTHTHTCSLSLFLSLVTFRFRKRVARIRRHASV